MSLKSIFFVLLVACGMAAVACPNPVPEFRSQTTAGRVVTPTSLTERPTVLVFLSRGCPENRAQAAVLNQLRKQLGEKVQVLAVFPGDRAAAEAERKAIGGEFELLPDPGRVLIQAFKATRSFDLSLVATKAEARWPKLWEGLSRENITQVLDVIARHGHEVPEVDLAAWPEKPVRGCMIR